MPESPEKARIRVAKWREENRDRHRAYSSQWAKEHRDHYRAIQREAQRRRRLRKGPKEGRFPLYLYSDPCVYCGIIGGEVDHIEPIALGGTDELNNLTSACRHCNSSKRTKSLLFYLLERHETSVRT